MTLYVAVSSSGLADGSDWSNTLAASFAPARGNTYYLADGTYGSKTFSAATSGTTLITIKKATAADHGTETGWSSTYGDGVATFTSVVFSTSYWTLDGQTGSGTTGHGIEIDTNNASLDMVTISGAISNITVAHCNIHSQADGRTHAQLIAGTFCVGVYSTSASSNLTFKYNYIHDLFGAPFLFRFNDTILIENCTIARNGSTPELHAEGLSDHGSDNVTIRFNKWIDMTGTAFIAGLGGDVLTISDNWKIYSNVFAQTPGSGFGTSAVITVIDPPHPAYQPVYATNWKIYNNTIATMIGDAKMDFNSPSGDSILIKNNLFFQNRPNELYERVVNFTLEGTNNVHTYNYYALCAFPGSFTENTGENDIYWGPNCQISDAVGFPGFVSAGTHDYRLNSEFTTYARAALGSPYDTDINGITFTTSFGAYQFVFNGAPLIRSQLSVKRISLCGRRH